ncbi:hypothetical protein RJT34_32386 [Clitoria ternatea]|uniref:ABC transporter domain-containing protein n=1 Tax=Clitoria ternatea TaxID=43366 RepID=A0AAN9I9E7_CLITE
MELTPRGRNQGHVLNFERDADSFVDEDKELQSKWAAIEKLPTFKRIKTSFVDVSQEEGGGSSSKEADGKRVVDVTKLGAVEKRLFIDKLIKHIENDNLQLLQKLRERMDRVNVKLPTVEVKYKNLNVGAECEVVQGKALPTLWNSFSSLFSGFMNTISCNSQGAEISILNDVSGIIKPSRLTLLLGPPGCGKTTLLMALAGKLEQSLKVSGEISYNGYNLDEFVPQKTSAYISQYDLHIPEMTVRETIDFSARCQGVGSRANLVAEITRREKEEGIIPDPDIDTYMKILGLDICADTLIGDALDRGISGGQKKRLTTGEMIVGPIKTLFMDEISTGLDSSTTFQIVTCLQQLVHITDATAVLSLLQPAPETYELFDDLILMAEGKIVYHGPRSQALQFFKDCGFWCPERKGVADFLQEVISKKDQRQYWYRNDIPYRYVSVDDFSQIFKSSYWGRMLNDELSQQPYDKSESQKDALSFSKYSLGKLELFKACMRREILLMKRNSFIYVFKTAQLTITAIITMTVFLRTQRAVDLIGANYLLGSLYYTLVRLMTNGVAELIMTITRLPVVDKQNTFYLYPAWAYCLPAAILKIPFSVLDSIVWTSVTYYVIGYSPEITRQVLCSMFLRQFLLLVTLHMSSTSMCRFLASVFKTDVAATTIGSLVLVLMFLFGGFILPRPSLPWWLRWGFWLSPMTYGEIGITLNEFLAPRWQTIKEGSITVGREVLRSHGLDFHSNFYWISIGALLGFTILFDFGFVLALTYIKQPKMSRALVSKKKLSQMKGRENSNSVELRNVAVDIGNQSTGKMVLPFEPLTISFKDVQYFVDTPPKFVQEVLETIELDDIKDYLVGIPGQSGLSTEQRKRLTVAVELVSNPSIIFMDEPTSGLDARAAAVVMRAVKNVVATGRTIVCTIHQPSIDIFETFDELILMKSGGQIIYSGMLGHHSSRLIEYFQSIPGVPKIKDNYNPATWMLESTSASLEAELQIDFAQIYKESHLYRDTLELVTQLSEPQPVFWQKGGEINNQQDLFNVLGSMYIAVIFLGVNYCSTILPYVATERSVLYREKFAGMYSSTAYSFAQVAIEIPYILVQSILYVAITYPMIVYTIFNLFSGFLMPGPKIPKWWVWCYWICPTAWSLNGLLTSQYGDMDKEILIFGEPKQIGSFLRDYYGFRHDRLSLVAVVLIAFPIAYASLFAYCIGKINYQNR